MEEAITLMGITEVTISKGAEISILVVMILLFVWGAVSSYMILYYLFKRHNAYKLAFDMEKRVVLIEKYERSFTKAKYRFLAGLSISFQVVWILALLMVFIWLKETLQYPDALKLVLIMAIRFGGVADLIICILGLWILRKPPKDSRRWKKSDHQII